VALLAPERVRRLVMDGVAIFDAQQTADILANYTPPLCPRDDGAHLLFAWHFLRDQTLYWPWYNRTAEGLRATEPIGAQELAVWLLELLKSGHTYPLAYRAAFRHPVRERLPLLHTPTLMAASAGDMLHAATAEAAELAPDARFATLPDDADGVAAVLAAFLDHTD
jgi:pimeloyl-ACP methyl ester carboxylesterase